MPKDTTGVEQPSNIISLDNMDLSELKKLKKDLDKAVSSYEDRKKSEVLAKIQAVIDGSDFSAKELGVQLPGARKKVSAPKFWNPDDHDQTWIGRGQRPVWVKDGLKKHEVVKPSELPEEYHFKGKK
ncbi:MAG: H-NS histone family protein [Okeania sp. SIO3H1]|nr:H-NS histone family protein [Okeania sp. SIO3H1]